jgi:PAS domain S-box-containing protein
MQNHLASAHVLQILVADDIQASRLQLCEMVRKSGHAAHGVDSGTAAVAQVLAQSPDLVLLDLLMPDMDGFEVTQKLRALVTDRWLPVIVTSSLEGEEHFIHALQRGADDYLVRPINPALLDAKLRHYAKVLGLQSRLAVLAQRQRDIHDNILDAVITLDGTGIIEEGNLAAMRIFGNGIDRLDGQHCEAVLNAPLSDLLSLREILITRSDGTRFPAELALSQWTEAQRVRYTMVIRDVTEQRHIDRIKDEFLATVSHELRTPLTSVLGALGLLASGAAGTLPKAAIPLAEVAKRNGERLSRLIDDILDITKLEGNQMVLQLRPTCLDNLLQEAMTANTGYAQRSGVKLGLELTSGSPAVRVDGDRFLQVMANLLSNAIKHSIAGDTVSVSLEWTPTKVLVKVRDHGPGIDPQFRSRMFEKFSQADASDRRAQGGTGLGLYITRMLVERMGGRIAVDSVPDQGATFFVEFPTASSSLQVPAPWLLHIDNDLDARRRVAEWVSALCRVEGAGNLEQAQALVLDAAPPIILADPQAQGSAEEFCACLRKMAQGRAVVLFTDAVDATFVRRMGMGWLQKAHCGREELMAALRPVIANADKEPHHE